MNDRTRLPQGYEPHELPPDYTGKLWIEGQMRAYSDAENAALREQVQVLREALDHTEKTLIKQLALISERAPGDYLDKRPVVQSLQMHAKRCRAALEATK